MRLPPGTASPPWRKYKRADRDITTRTPPYWRSHSTARCTVSAGSAITSSGTTACPYTRPSDRPWWTCTAQVCPRLSWGIRRSTWRGRASASRSSVYPASCESRWPPLLRTGNAAVRENGRARVRLQQTIWSGDRNQGLPVIDRRVVLVTPPRGEAIRVDETTSPAVAEGWPDAGNHGPHVPAAVVAQVDDPACQARAVRRAYGVLNPLRERRLRRAAAAERADLDVADVIRPCTAGGVGSMQLPGGDGLEMKKESGPW